MTEFMKELVFPIFKVPLENHDYIISLQTEGQPQEIFDQENMNGKTISEVGIKHLDALTIMIVHKDYNNWSPPLPPSPQLRRKSKRITEGQRERQTKAVRFQENAARQEKLEEKKKQEVRTKRDKTKDAMNNPMAIQNKKIKIAGEGLRLSDGKKVTGDITTKKMAAQQNNENNLMASGSSTTNSLSNSLKGELLIRKEEEIARMRVASVDGCRFCFENCENQGVSGGNHEIVAYKKVVFMKEIKGNVKNTDFVHIYKLDVVKNALKASIEMLSFEGIGLKINPTLIAERSPALFWSLVFQYKEKKIPCHRMLLEVLTKDDWTHLDDGRVRKPSAKAMENQRQETEEAVDTVVSVMVVHDPLFIQAMSLITETKCSVTDAEMAVVQAQSLLSVHQEGQDGGLDKPISQILLGRTWLHLYIKRQLAKPDPPVSMQFLLDATRDSFFSDHFEINCGSNEDDNNINGKGELKSDDNNYEENDDRTEEDDCGDDDGDDDDDEDGDDNHYDSGILSEIEFFVTEAEETLREEEDKMNTILGRGEQLSTANGNRLTFLCQELVSVYILSGINYSIMNKTSGALACFKSAMRYTDKELKVKNSITLDIMERLNLQRMSVTAYALFIREMMNTTEQTDMTIPTGEVDGQVENRIYMESGGDADENYNHEFIMNHFAMADLMLKTVICTAKPCGLDESERASRLAIGMNEIGKKLGMAVNGVGE